MSLCNDIILYIFEYLDDADRLRGRKTCSQWYNTIEVRGVILVAKPQLSSFDINKHFKHNVNSIELYTGKLDEKIKASKFNITVDVTKLTRLVSTSSRWPPKPTLMKMTSLEEIHLPNRDIMGVYNELKRFRHLQKLTLKLSVEYLVLPLLPAIRSLNIHIHGHIDYGFVLNIYLFKELEELNIRGEIDIIRSHRELYDHIKELKKLRYFKAIFSNTAYTRIYSIKDSSRTVFLEESTSI